MSISRSMRERDHRARHAAVWRHRTGVGDDAARRRRHIRARHRDRAFPPWPSAARPRRSSDSTNRRRHWRGRRPTARAACASRIEGALQRDVLIAAVEARDQILAPVLDPGDRASGACARARSRPRTRAQRHLLPEAAADIRRDRPADRNSGIPISSAMMVRIACGIWVVQVSVTRPIVAVPCRMRGARLQRQGILPARADVDLDAPVRRAPSPRRSRRSCTRPSTTTLAGASPCTRGAPGEKRLARIDDRRRLLDLDLDEIGDVFGLLRASPRPPRRSVRRRSARRPSPGRAGSIGT